MAKRAELRARLSLNNLPFMRSISQAARAAKDLAKQFAKHPIRTTSLVGLLAMRKATMAAAASFRALSSAAANVAKVGFLTLSAAAAASAAILARGVANAYELGAQLSDMSKKTGIAVDQMMILNEAAKENGIEDITGAVKKMQKNLVDAVRDGTGPAAKSLALLGLNAADLANQLPSDALKAIGDKIAAIQNPALRTAEAMAIFGKQGADLLPLFENSGALGDAAQNIGRQADILRANAEKFRTVSIALSSIGLKMQGFFVGVAETILPMMEAVAKRFQALDLATVGERFGAGIRVGVNFLVGAFSDPSSLVLPLTDALKAGLAEAGNVLVAALKSAAELFANAKMWAAVGNSFRGLGEIIGGTLMQHFKEATDSLRDMMEFAMEKSLALWETIVDKVTPGGSNEKNEQLERVSKGRWDEKEQAYKFDPINERMYGQSRSLREIRRQNDAKGRENVGKDTVEQGNKRLAESASQAADALKDVGKNFTVEDIFGAKPAWEKAINGFTLVEEAGKKLANQFIEIKAQTLVPSKKQFSGFGDHSGAGPMGGLRSGHLTSGGLSQTSFGSAFKNSKFIGPQMPTMLGNSSSLNREAFNSSNLLSAREKRTLGEGARASYMAHQLDLREAWGKMTKEERAKHPDLAPGEMTPDGITRRGDRKRMQEFQKNKEKEKFGVDKSNSLLAGILQGQNNLSGVWGAAQAAAQ